MNLDLAVTNVDHNSNHKKLSESVNELAAKSATDDDGFNVIIDFSMLKAMFVDFCQ